MNTSGRNKNILKHHCQISLREDMCGECSSGEKCWLWKKKSSKSSSLCWINNDHILENRIPKLKNPKTKSHWPLFGWHSWAQLKVWEKRNTAAEGSRGHMFWRSQAGLPQMGNMARWKSGNSLSPIKWWWKKSEQESWQADLFTGLYGEDVLATDGEERWRKTVNKIEVKAQLEEAATFEWSVVFVSF